MEKMGIVLKLERNCFEKRAKMVDVMSGGLIGDPDLLPGLLYP